MLLPAFPRPFEFTVGFCEPVPAGAGVGVPSRFWFSPEALSVAACDSIALDPEAVAVPTPLLAVVDAPTAVFGPALVVVTGSDCKGVVDPPAFGISVGLSV